MLDIIAHFRSETQNAWLVASLMVVPLLLLLKTTLIMEQLRVIYDDRRYHKMVRDLARFDKRAGDITAPVMRLDNRFDLLICVMIGLLASQLTLVSFKNSVIDVVYLILLISYIFCLVMFVKYVFNATKALIYHTKCKADLDE